MKLLGRFRSEKLPVMVQLQKLLVQADQPEWWVGQ